MVNSAIFTIIFACIIAIIAVAINNQKANMELASKEIVTTDKTETMQGQEEQGSPKALTEITAGTPNTDNFTYVTSGDGHQVPVPKGYVASSDAEERYVNGVTKEGTREHHGGFVIYERLASDAGKTDAEVQAIIEDDMDEAQRTRNQFVWVPIADAGDMYHTSRNLIYANSYTFSASSYSKSTSDSLEPAVSANFDSSEYCDLDHTHLKRYMENVSRKDFLQEMQEEFYEMLKSVATYGGFYIGRYETGNINQNKAVVVKGNSNIYNVPWYKMYTRSRNIRGTNSVHTGLIWGIQWDETMKWLIDSGEKTYEEVCRNSKDWGNYDLYNGKIGMQFLRPTGYSEEWKANNIYDLAGNVWEWTLQSSGSSKRFFRGGSYLNSSDYDAACRYSDDPRGRWKGIPSTGQYQLGCRTTLYVI